jgi:hypothetical protein
MDSTPTHEDANLILRLYELRREETLRRARAWFAQNFHVTSMESLQALCPPASEQNAYFRMVVTYWEMAASFVASGVLNKDLFFQSTQELLLVWSRVRGVVAEMRVAYKNPNSWKNLEAVGNSYIEHLERTAPGAYAAFRERLGPPAAKPRS